MWQTEMKEKGINYTPIAFFGFAPSEDIWTPNKRYNPARLPYPLPPFCKAFACCFTPNAAANMVPMVWQPAAVMIGSDP